MLIKVRPSGEPRMDRNIKLLEEPISRVGLEMEQTTGRLEYVSRTVCEAFRDEQPQDIAIGVSLVLRSRRLLLWLAHVCN